MARQILINDQKQKLRVDKTRVPTYIKNKHFVIHGKKRIMF